MRVDTIRGVNGSVGIGAAAEGNKWAVSWHHIVDYHWYARVFDGTTLKDEVDLGTDTYSAGNLLLDDGNGRAFSQNDDKRRILDWSTGTFEAETTFSETTSYTSLAAIPGGGAISLYRNGANTNIVSDRWLPGTPTWTATNLAAAVGYEIRVYANAAGKAIGLWYNSTATDTTLSVVAFDGSNWGTAATKTFDNASGSLNTVDGAILASGDFLLVTQRGGNGTLQSYKFNAGAGTFDAAVDVGQSVNNQSTRPSIVIDASDRITLAYLDSGHAKARRDVGAGWLAEQDLGAATMVKLAVDRTSSNVVAVTYAAPSLSIHALTGTGNTWSAAVTMTGLGITNQMFAYMVSTVFDGSGHPMTFAEQEAAGTGGLELSYVKCQ